MHWVELEGLPYRAAPGSTVAGAVLCNLLVLAVIEEIQSRGDMPPVLVSRNVEGGDEHNQALFARYRHRLVR